MRLMLSLGLGLAAAAAAVALQGSAAAQDPPPLPIPGPSIVTGNGTTPLHRFEINVRIGGRESKAAFGRATFEPRVARAVRWSVQVTCLRIAENRAVLGGPALRAGRPAGGVLVYVEDNARSGAADRISRLQGFRVPPNQCPEPIMPARAAQRVQGDIVVRGIRGG